MYKFITYETDQAARIWLVYCIGADPNVKVTSADESAFCGAIIFDRAEVVKAFIESGKVNINAPQCGTPDHKNTPLEQAHKYENKSTETIKLLVEAGADTKYLNQYNYDGNINYSGETSFIKDICQEQ